MSRYGSAVQNIIPENYIAALDIGSNSFHFVYGRLIDNHLQILHTEKYQVRLADGLDKNKILSEQAIARGISTLKKLSETVKNLNRDNFRVVATYTLRHAKNSQTFLDAANKVFPFDIDIISGHEEARLIYQGVINKVQSEENIFVIDIGGGSTECAIGKHKKTKVLASLSMGCVSFTQQFFANKSISQDNFNRAIRAAREESYSIAKSFKRTSWKTVIGTSGTIKALSQLINFTYKSPKKNKQSNQVTQSITVPQLYKLQQSLMTFDFFDNIELAGLKENRRDVICAGLAILIGLMEALSIKELNYCQYALREGVLFEQIEELSLASSINPKFKKHHNICQRTINSLLDRFSVDIEQADNVWEMANKLYQECAQQWDINEEKNKTLLFWAVQLHELGFDINSSGYQKHGQYIIKHADCAGFNQEQQQALSWLVGTHRKKIVIGEIPEGYQIKQSTLIKLVILLRLAVLLTQQRQLSDVPSAHMIVGHQCIELQLDKKWLSTHPIINNALSVERKILHSIGIELRM